MYIVSYDLSDDRLRRKVAKKMLDYGVRVQYSVFECNITGKQKDKMYAELTRMLAEDAEGSIRIYDLCARCTDKTQVIGIMDESRQDDDDTVIII